MVEKKKNVLTKLSTCTAENALITNTVSAKLAKGKELSKNLTCISLNLMSELATSPARSCSMYSNTRYMLLDD